MPRTKQPSVQDRFKLLRHERIEAGKPAVPKSLQGVTKARIAAALEQIDLRGADIIDCVFALLDDKVTSFKGHTFSEGASTAQLGSHIAFLQREELIKLDREGRDYWIKPLTQVGAIEPVTLIEDTFVPGHVKAKSPNSSYRLNKEFVDILRSPEGEWRDRLRTWISADSTRRRLEVQAKAAEESRKAVDTGHRQLIADSVNTYAKNFLPGYEVLYVDDSDGDRITKQEIAKLAEAGIELKLEDAFPDALLWNRSTDHLWCIEAVTSDGEVDAHKVTQMRKLAERHGKSGIGFTTTYRTWKSAASRQDANRNLAIGSHVWIASDPTRQLLITSFEES